MLRRLGSPALTNALSAHTADDLCEASAYHFDEPPKVAAGRPSQQVQMANENVSTGGAVRRRTNRTFRAHPMRAIPPPKPAQYR